MFLFYTFIFILGSIIGSFLNVVIDRLPAGMSIIKGRSHCDHCRRKLAWIDMVPIVSYLFLGGKCRYCHKELSIFYPIVEALTGLSFAIIALLVIGQNVYLLSDTRYLLTLIYLFYIISSLIIIFFVDLKFFVIPFSVIIPALLITIIWYALLPVLHINSQDIPFFTTQPGYFLNYIYSGFGVFIFFLSIFLFTKGRGLGFGDVVYVIFMGFLLGFPKIILGLYITFITGAVISLILIATKLKKLRGGVIPFGPFLVFGTVISLLWGNFLINKILIYLFAYSM